MKQYHFYLMVIALLFGITTASAQDNATPEFKLWFECVQRGPYEGMAQAVISYSYAGEFPLAAEDARYFGDTATGNTLVWTFTVEPGEHNGAFQVNVGAQKAVTLKVILFSELHVITLWDNPEILDCAWDIEATPEPTVTPEGGSA